MSPDSSALACWNAAAQMCPSGHRRQLQDGHAPFLERDQNQGYALFGGKKNWKNDAERVAFLFELYQRYTSLLPQAAAKPKAKRRMLDLAYR